MTEQQIALARRIVAALDAPRDVDGLIDSVAAATGASGAAVTAMVARLAMAGVLSVEAGVVRLTPLGYAAAVA